MTCNGKGQFGFGGTIGFEKIIGWNMENANVSVWEDDYFPMNRKIAAEFIYKLKWAQFESGLSYFNEHYQTSIYKGPRTYNRPVDFESDNLGIPLKIKFRLNIPKKENFFYFLTESGICFQSLCKKNNIWNCWNRYSNYVIKEFGLSADIFQNKDLVIALKFITHFFWKHRC